MKKIIMLVSCLSLMACVSEQERQESLYRFEETMRNQCEHQLGFRTGTQNYMNCRMFYDEYLTAQGYSLDYMSFSTAQSIQNQIGLLNSQCSRYWGTSGISGNNLWACVQQLGNKTIQEAAHQKELKEQEELLTRSISAGQTDAYDSARLQDRIDAEREKVAKATGKNPKKVECRTYTKSNGYVQVKCK